jgi:5'-nucleotidase
MVPKPIQITILHTNDMHSQLESMSRLSGLARQLHQELKAKGRHVFFFDAGDAADRRERFCSVTKGAAFPRLLGSMGDHGYDLQTLGNAISVTYGLQAATHMAKQAPFPILAANFFQDFRPLLDGFQAVQSYPLNKDLRLGVIGLTAELPDFYRLFGLDTPKFKSVVDEWLEYLLKNGHGPIIVLSHLGLVDDRKLAHETPEIDVIIGGHTHNLLLEGEWVNGVLIAQAGEYARYLGRVDLDIDPRDGSLQNKSASMIEIPENAPPDPIFDAALQEVKQEAAQFMTRPVGELKQALDQDFFSECGIGDLAADAIRERMQAEAALLTSGLFLKGLPAGVVTLFDLDDACFTTANPQLSLVRGEQILAAIERGLDPESARTYIKAFRGAPIGIPAVSGMIIEYHPDNPFGQRVRAIKIQNQPLEYQRTYRLAHTDAELISKNLPGAGFLELEPGQLIRTEIPTILREAIEEYMAAHSPLPVPTAKRWLRSIP